jgi:hypothetical protein
MQIYVELFSNGISHARKVYMYDDMMGCMVRGFSIRLFGVFLHIVWRTK